MEHSCTMDEMTVLDTIDNITIPCSNSSHEISQSSQDISDNENQKEYENKLNQNIENLSLTDNLSVLDNESRIEDVQTSTVIATITLDYSKFINKTCGIEDTKSIVKEEAPIQLDKIFGRKILTNEQFNFNSILNLQEQSNDSLVSLQDSSFEHQLIPISNMSTITEKSENLSFQTSLTDSYSDKPLKYKGNIIGENTDENLDKKVDVKNLLNDIVEEACKDTKIPLKIHLRRMLDLAFGKPRTISENRFSSTFQEDYNNNLEHHQDCIEKRVIVEEHMNRIEKNIRPIPSLKITPATPK